MQEFTFIYPPTQLEFMVDLNEETGKIITCYTYINDFNKDKQDPQIKWMDPKLFGIKWKKGRNPLFEHNKNAFRRIANSCTVVAENDNEVELLTKVMRTNKISEYTISY